MARKGQKFNKYSEELKQKVLEEYFKGEGGTKVLGKKYKISFHTIDTWVDMVKYPERHLGTGKKRGRPKDSEINWKERYEILKKYQAFLKAQRERK
jgi:transposase-like protein